MDKLKEQLNALELSDEAKELTIKAFDVMLTGARFYIIRPKDESIKEYARLINNMIVIKSKEYEYAGQTALRNERVVDLETFAKYLEARKDLVEEAQMNVRTK